MSENKLSYLHEMVDIKSLPTVGTFEEAEQYPFSIFYEDGCSWLVVRVKGHADFVLKNLKEDPNVKDISGAIHFQLYIEHHRPVLFTEKRTPGRLNMRSIIITIKPNIPVRVWTSVRNVRK